MGIRRKVTIGFACLAALVAGAGVVSFFELRHIGTETRLILDESNRNMTISRELLDGAEMLHLALLHDYTVGSFNGGNDSLYTAGRRLFADALAKGHEAGQTAMDGIQAAYSRYEGVVREYFTSGAYFESDWLKTNYWTTYMRLTDAIKEYMTGAEYNLGTHAAVLRHNAYRAITPSLVTLGVVLLLLVLLLYFIDIYYMKPVVAMNRSVKGWLSSAAPFNAKVEGKDETGELKENIMELIARIKKSAVKIEN